ncbi:F-box/WD40 repeat-containing protein [Endozoicomonas sp. GU-1]|uniref:F-box/WD40 repeat-containing protein n=1 Tax=Endozoicomonas sp. GU-1 TaxID=3009078 RepID=UPI0022B4DE97|nr:F-box/WD40 repeat-containing protein [Endozoicomonas sp. GU-1]WBA82234.1 F-box/WD40 repeat-containing protein [Endozoicomonas sp. GU-1]WBA85171.1 F-box/WD40 repeat-containing protein [Endozoicomonas sp. GU-1]
MSDPLFPRAADASIAPNWPVNEPAKTTPPSSAIALPAASPQTQFPQQQPLWQRRITELPHELLAIIFDHLEFDDIRHVNATCLAFRDVVKECKYIQQLSYFARLPRRFREQFQQHVFGQKKSWCFHPFATPASRNNRGISFRDRIIKNLPQMSALLCLDTLGRMESRPAYRMVKRLKVTIPQRAAWHSQPQAGVVLGVHFSPSCRHLLFYGRCLNDSRVLARDDQGQWAEEHLYWSDNSRSRVVSGANFSPCENRLFTWNGMNRASMLQPAHNRWDENDKLMLSGHAVVFSPSGEYMAAYKQDPFIVCHMDNNNNKWRKVEINGLSGELTKLVLFSSSERYLALLWSHLPSCANEITMLSLNDCSAKDWKSQRLKKCKDDYVTQAQFSPVTDQFLVGFEKHHGIPGRVSMYSLEPSGEWEETMIFPYFCPVFFSSTGQYLFNKASFTGFVRLGMRQDMQQDRVRDHDVLLWRIPENLSAGPLDDGRLLQQDAVSRAILDSEIGLRHNSLVKVARFSPSDNHLLVSCESGTVYIWGKSQTGQWAIEAITGECAPITVPWFSPSGLHVLTWNPSMVGILGRNGQQHWSLKGGIKQDGILKAYFNPLSEHEVMVLSQTQNGDVTNIHLQVWEIRDAGTPD